jgi:hypothetical protein
VYLVYLFGGTAQRLASNHGAGGMPERSCLAFVAASAEEIRSIRIGEAVVP